MSAKMCHRLLYLKSDPYLSLLRVFRLLRLSLLEIPPLLISPPGAVTSIRRLTLLQESHPEMQLQTITSSLLRTYLKLLQRLEVKSVHPQDHLPGSQFAQRRNNRQQLERKSDRRCLHTKMPGENPLVSFEPSVPVYFS